MRPPLRSLRWIEDFLSALLAAGFSQTAAVDDHRACTSFLLGHLLLEVAVRDAGIGPLGERGLPDLGVEQTPRIVDLRHESTENRSTREFDEALEDLLERIELMRSQG